MLISNTSNQHAKYYCMGCLSERREVDTCVMSTSRSPNILFFSSYFDTEIYRFPGKHTNHYGCFVSS